MISLNGVDIARAIESKHNIGIDKPKREDYEQEWITLPIPVEAFINTCIYIYYIYIYLYTMYIYICDVGMMRAWNQDPASQCWRHT